MPTTPSLTKLFFCRVTAPLNEDLMAKLPRHIKTKHYVHYFTEFYYVHENGLKTEKPHYHLLILCKTTKHEIQKYIKYNWNIINYEDDNTASGNAMFSVSDKYLPESKDMSLAYMLKGGLNKIYEDSSLKPGWTLCPHDEIYIDDTKYQDLILLYRTHITDKLKKDKNTFEEKYELIKTKLHNHGHEFKDCYIGLLRFIYHVLIHDEIRRKKIIKRHNLWDWSFTLTLHFVNFREQVKLIQKTIDDQLKKNLDILD